MKTKLSALVISMFAAVSAFAAGDIYEIRPCTEGGINTVPYATYDNPLGSGTSNIYFNVRLKLRGDGSNPNRDALRRKYTLEFWDPAAEWQEHFDEVNNPLKIGIYVSGNLRYASLQAVIPNELSGVNFFDCVFMYKPQAGDFALPVRLAVEDDEGNIYPADENDSFATYHFTNKNLWKIRYYDEDDPSRNGEVVWKFCDNPDAPGGKRPNGGSVYTPTEDYSLKGAGIYVQTVDFDQEEWVAPGEYWREVPMGDELECFLKVDSEATGAIQDSTFYVWSMDESAVKVQSAEPPVEIVTNIDHGVEQKMTVSIGTITIKGGSVTKNFYIDGIESNKIAKLVLSPWKGFSFGHYTSEILEDYKTIPVKCGPPPVPSVNISFDKDRPTAASAKKLLVNPSTNYLDRASEAVPVYITLSQPYETDMHVNIAVRYEKDAARDPIADKFLSVSQNGDEYSSSDIYYTNVLFKVGETQHTIYVYPLGGNADTKSEGIGFYPVIQEAAPAAIYEAGDRALLQINSLHAPVIVLPKNDHDYGTVSGAAGEGFDISLQVNDCLRDMENTNGFTVTFGGALKSQPATNFVFTAGEAFDFTVTGYDKKKEGLQIATIKVSEPAEPGMTPKSAIVQVYFTVAVEKDKLVYVNLYDTTAASSLHDGTLFDEGSAPIPMFYVNEPMSAGESLYFFLRPLNEASSNLVSCAAFTQGIELVGGQTNTVRSSAFALNFLDGCAITESTGSLEYEIFARTSPKLDEGAPSNVYIPAQKLVINVANVFPRHEGLYIAGNSTPVANGGHYHTPISSSVTNSYVAMVTDVSEVDVTNGLYVIWNFTEGYSFAPSFEYEWTFATNDAVQCFHSFETEDATQTVSFVAIDKDMLASLGGVNSLSNLQTLWPRLVKMVGPEGVYKATVYVSNRPYIKLVDEFDSTSITIAEDTDKNDGHTLKITLSEPAKQNLQLKVTVKTYSDYTDPKQIGTLDFNTTTLTIAKDKTVPTGEFKELKYNYHNLDGAPGSADAGFFVTIDVVAPVALSNYYQRAEAEIYVNNRPPIISPKQGDVVTTNKTIAAGEPFSLEWSAKDERIDMEYGLTAKWYIDDMLQSGLTVTGITSNDTHITSNIVINAEGLHEVKLIVSDKDGEDYDGVAERRWLYYIAPTKKLQIRPFGPASTTESYYDSAAGIGKGRVYADGTRSTVQAFVQTWFYSVDTLQANMYAAGYPSAAAPYADDGSLGTGVPKRDVALDPNGEKWTAGDYYEYDGVYDNFFYRWVYIGSQTEGGASTSQYSKVEIQTKSGAEVVAPPYKLAALAGEISTVEAIFSREMKKSDNLGDINADGVPDLYAKMYRFDVFDAQGNLIGDDAGVDSLEGWTDGDYLPGSTNLSVKASWGVTNTWSIDALPFDTAMELRGMDGANSHFNDAYEILAAGIGTGKPMALLNGVTADKVFTMPYYNATTGVQTNDSTLSEVEYVAFTNYCAKMGWDPAAEEHWGLKNGSYDNSWSPERPTDPTKSDTDGDLLSDGFEYFLWYHAHVGELVDGKLVRLTGHRYNQYDPGRPIEISPEEIERLFDPLTKSLDIKTRDTDNDGLTDFEEFALGTDPINWDTDGDGLPDGWEVHYLQSDPLKYATVGTQCDALMNEDHDAMAWMQFKMHMVAELVLDDAGKIIGTNNVYLSDTEFATIGDADSNRYLRVNQGADFICYTGWVYGVNGPWAIQTPGTTNVAVMTNFVVSKDAQVDVVRIHYQVYQHEGFDPRTGWNMKPCKDNHIVNTKDYIALDEFLLQAFYWRNSGILAADMEIKPKDTVLTLWAKTCTDPNKADTDDDGMPDGWELYVQAPVEASGKDPDPATYGPDCWVSPKTTYKPVGDVDPPTSGDGLLWPEEFAGVESCFRYRDCPTITNPHPEWQNKVWPTDPWANDTDGDGLADGEELKHFVYGGKVRDEEQFDGCIEGGGLNPNFWDTDNDMLPDPWEVEFEGEHTTTDTPASTNITENADGTLSTNVTEATSTTEWGGGMNGTVNDAMADYDADGLNNWQEYMVGTMRCWRYDDTITTWVMHEPDLARVASADNEYIYGLIVDPESDHYNPGFRGMHVHPGVYMSWCNNKWDQSYGKFYYFKDGIYHDLKKEAQDPALMFQNRWHRRVPFPPPGFSIAKNYPTKYICCDPRNRDTDEDGMDDFYELFHGLNPIYGTLDLVCDSWNVPGTIPWSAVNNYWTSSVGRTRTDYERRLKGVTNSPYDFFQYPWLAGEPTADPDGDNIRNIYESIMSHMQAESTYLHTDPSPLWMTDISYPDSLTYRFYYMMDPYWNLGGILAFIHPTGKFTHTVTDEMGNEHTTTYELNDFPWLHWDSETGVCMVDYDINYWSILDTMYSFEQNEGYDTDGDYLGDFEESQGKTKSASNPQDFDDPLRRQAMYFGGKDDPGFLQTSLSFSEMTPAGGIAPADHMFLYFTVECWAKADASDIDSPDLQTLVERPIWTGAANAADESYLRKNFLIGLKGGRWYTKFDSTGTDRKQAVEITDGPEATTNWTHVAATYDGTALKLYVDGVCCNTHKTSIQPEHGVAAAFHNFGIDPPDDTKRTDVIWADEIGNRSVAYQMISILIGADARTYYGIAPDLAWHERNVMAGVAPYYYNTAAAATFNDYTGFFKGYIDEVRIWDGARPASDILADVKSRKRYSRDDALANRSKILGEISSGYGRSPLSTSMLSPELRYHWSFDHVPGAVDPDDVAKSPAGFVTSDGMTDGMAVWARPVKTDGTRWVTPWLLSIDPSIRSSVYSDMAWVPWIRNTVSHLPRMDGLTRDSLFWAENYAGGVPATQYGLPNYDFARTAEAQCSWYQMLYVTPAGVIYSQSYPTYTGDLYEFSMRETHTEGDDLVPFGSAYAKRISATEGGMWDDLGAADAWAETKVDSDHNGLPDWWEQYARQNLSPDLRPWDNFKWDTTVIYNGLPMPAWRAYLRDLARGLLPDGKYHDGTNGTLDYRDTRDLDRDGMPDWWEDMYGIDTGSVADAKADPDNDGLSNYQEYLIEQDGLYLLNPALTRTFVGQVETDYFLQTTNAEGKAVYLGEVYADHDFMEDDVEDVNGYDRTRYDAWADPDEDGWSNFAEMRYAGFKMDTAARFATHYFAETEVKDFPIPVVHATLRYHGDSGTGGATNMIYVEAYSGNNLQKSPSAVYAVTPGSVQSRTIYLGEYSDRVFHGTLTPGHVQAGKDNIQLEGCFIQQNDKWTWLAGGVLNYGTYEEMYRAFCADPTIQITRQENQWFQLQSMLSSQAILQISVDDKTQKGYLLLDYARVGEIDMITGDFSIDLTPIKNYIMADTLVAVPQLFFRINYKTMLPTMQYNKLSISLAEPDQGILSEGKTAFVAWMDKDGDGVYTPGVDPIGFVKDVDIGWDQVPAIDIEMTDASQAAGRRFSYATASNDTVRVVRIGVNGNTEGVQPRIIFSRSLAAMPRNYVFEGDLVSGGKYGLDWDNLRADLQAMEGIKLKDVTSVEYAVVDGACSMQNLDTNLFITTFSVEYTSEAIKPTAYSPSEKADGIVETVRPTFRWTGADGYTAFRLQIYDATGANKLYDSDVQTLPARDTSSRYYWTAPVFIGTDVLNDAWALDNHKSYKWRVAMYNQKFSETTDGASMWSDWATMRAELADTNDKSTLYGTVKTVVKYFGPATNSLDQVVVQLFKNADLTGVPAAQTRLFDVSGDISELTNGVEVVFHGLDDGEYYACAFIDRNDGETGKGDCVRQRYETWGYSAQVGLNYANIWNPLGVRSFADSVEIPSVTVYMEDTDINGDDVLDWDQDEELLKAASTTAGESALAGDSDGDGLSDFDEGDKSYTKANMWDTDGDGMPDGWEYLFAGTDPLTADGDKVIAGDYMAYAEYASRVITARSTATGAEVTYIVPGTNEYHIGDNVNNEEFYSTYDYNGIYGRGKLVTVKDSEEYVFATVTNTLGGAEYQVIFELDNPVVGIGTNVNEETAWLPATDSSGAYILGAKTNLNVTVLAETNLVTAVVTNDISLGENRVISINNSAKVALVHAQVYDEFGFTQTAAVDPADEHTKPFTALDKYLVIRYLSAIGIGPGEEEINKKRLWKYYSLIPMITDGDGISDLADDKSAIKQVKDATDKYGDGIADGWELYVMFGTNGVTNVVASATMKPAATEINPWKYGDRSDDVDDDALDLVHEYSEGKDPSDPWDPYSVYKLILEEGVIEEGTEPFLDSEVRRFGVKKDDIDDDWDLDMISNGQEVWGYYKDRVALADICETNAWSDGFTPDYFRALTNLTPVTYLGEIYNGAEFIEPSSRKDLDLIDTARIGTRDIYQSGWDVWSIVRFSKYATDDSDSHNIYVNYLVKYLTVRYGEEFNGATEEEAIKFFNEKEGAACTTAESCIGVIGGLDWVKKYILDHSTNSLTNPDYSIPDPTIYLKLRYAGNDMQPLVVEAYQTASLYPEYGEQMVARWAQDVLFDSGVAYAKLEATGKGSLKQGKTRLVAYFDIDGVPGLSEGDTYGTTEINVGYTGADAFIRMGESNTSLPIIRLYDAESNRCQTVAIVRTKVNGEYITDAEGKLAPRGVMLRKYWNNLGRDIVYPTDYVTDDYIGLDKYLVSDYEGDEGYSSIESVTYEIVKVKASVVKDLEDDVSAISISNLNHYVYVEVVETAGGDTSNITHVVDQERNGEVTIHFPLHRDVPKEVVVDASATEDDYYVSFMVNDDGYSVTKFFLELDGNPFGDPDGYLLTQLTEGRAILDRDWIEKNCGVIGVGEHRVRVALGNDKFPESPTDDAEWSETAVFALNAAKVSEGNILVQVKHPLTNFTGNVTIAAYKRADLAEPVRVWTGKATDEVYTLDNLNKNGDYYIAAWYVKNAADGRDGARDRMPYDTWGYYTSIGMITNGFDAACITAVVKPTVTNTFWMQDTDWNDNNVIDLLENIKAINGVREIDENYYSIGDLDMDGVADVDDDDPVFDNGNESLERDVMAYAEVKTLCVQLGSMNDPTNWVWYAVLDPANEDTAVKVAEPIYIPRGTKAEDIKSLATTYIYGKKTSKLFGLGTNVVDTASLAGREVKNYEYKNLALMHHQVYQRFGFDPNTANARIPRDQWVNTKDFTKKDKYFVTNYLAAVGAVVDPNSFTNWVLNAKYIDFDFDGMPDGWELYTMYGTNAVKALTKAVDGDVINAWVRDDRDNDQEGDSVVNFHEYDGGTWPTDPWNGQSMYDYLVRIERINHLFPVFDDGTFKKFDIAVTNINADTDFDLITNWDEMRSYLYDTAALADIAITNAWSDGFTPDYFRSFTKGGELTYMGLEYNGGEFMESDVRKAMGLLTSPLKGTKDYNQSGWDEWSTARFSILNAEQTVNIDGVVSDELMLLIRYWNVIRPGEFTGTTVGEAIAFFHEVWAGVTRLIDYDGNVVIETKNGGVMGYGTIHVADAAQTTTQIVAFFCGQEKMEEVIARNKKDITADQIVTPEPKVNLVLKYADNGSYNVVLEAYQVNSAYPEYGEQLTAQWTTPVKFDSGLAKVKELRTPGLGSLKQGATRFIAYIDADGDGKLSAGDASGMVEKAVGYLGCDIEITLGDANTSALPVILLGDGGDTNGVDTVQLVAIVRTKVNGEYIVNAEGKLAPRGVILRKYWNNIGRGILYPSDYIADDFIGLDKYLASDYEGEENFSSVESVTYEIVKVKASLVKDLEEDVSSICVSNLNHYTYVEVVETADGDTSNITYIVDQDRNEEFTVRFPLRRDVPKNVIADGAATADDYFISFEVPNDGYAVSKFFLELDGNPFGDPDGFLLPQITGNKVILRRDWIEKNCGVIPAGEHRVTVALGNDKFPESPDDDSEWSAPAVFVMNAAKVSDGKIFVQVKHPLTSIAENVTVAVYEKSDLAEPVRTWTGKATDEVYTLDNLTKNGQYYIAAWYVKDAADGRVDATERKPYDTWGYLTRLGETVNGFEAKGVIAEFEPVVTNTLWMQDTDWNDNNVVDRLENIKAINGVREVDENYYSMGDLDMDGVADVDDDDPVFDNGDEVLERDVMAYAEVKTLCVQLGSMNDTTNWVWYAVLDPVNEETAVKVAEPIYIPRGTKAEDIKSLATTYIYGKKTSKLYGLGTNVVDTASLAGWEVKNYEYKTIALMHNQVYQRFGFNPNTANGLIDRDQWVNTKDFTKKDKYYVTNYLAAVGAIADPNTFTNWVLNAKLVDFDFDGMPDGWELYTMFGPHAPSLLSKEASVNAVNAWVKDDRALDPDSDTVPNFHEYDGGNVPTDPWNADTMGTGLGDKAASEYNIKGEDAYRRDGDNDQLPNFVEYLISSSDGFLKLDAGLMSTYAESQGQLVPDYFLRKGLLYYGEMFTDHDFIEDWWEDEYGAPYSRYTYDTVGDYNGNGWDNWSEARAIIAAGYKTDYIVVTNGAQIVSNAVQVSAYEGHPNPVGKIRIVYNGVKAFGGNAVVKAYHRTSGTVDDLNRVPDACWTFPVKGRDAVYELGKPVYGAVAQGESMFVVYVDDAASSDENAGEDGTVDESVAPEYVVGAPYGVVGGVMVGYASIADCEVELTDVSESVMRIDLVAASAANEFSAQVALNDRGVNGAPHNGNLELSVFGFTNSFEKASKVRVRILRTAMNGNSRYYNAQSRTYYYVGGTVVDTVIDTRFQPYLTEAVLVAAGALDVDWKTNDTGNEFTTVAQRNNMNNIVQTASYAVLIGDDPLEYTSGAETMIEAGVVVDNVNVLATLFVNNFENGAAGSQTKTVPTGVVLGESAARPTFTWTHENGIGKAYPAFRLRVWSAASGGTVVYDSGNLRAPVRNAAGKYSFTAPISVGVQLKAGVKYYYSVSMLDAKFRTPNGTETRYEFVMPDTSSGEGFSDYATIPVAVKYCGPGKVTDPIRVEAYASPDFCGKPLSVGYVKHTDTLADTDRIEINAELVGLNINGTCYIRAFLDTNGNGVRDEWESWGYGNYVGTDRKDVYTPYAYTFDEYRTNGHVPTAVVYIEDADTNGNKLPDVWEWNKNGKLGAVTGVTAASPYVVTITASGAVATNLFCLCESGTFNLPYYSALTKFINGGSISSVSLALAMAGIDLDMLDTVPEVRIVEFTNDGNIKLAVDAKATVDGETLVPRAIAITAKVTLALEMATSLDAPVWTPAATAQTTVEVGGETTVDAATLVDTASGKTFGQIVIDTVAANPSCFFRARVSVEK